MHAVVQFSSAIYTQRPALAHVRRPTEKCYKCINAYQLLGYVAGEIIQLSRALAISSQVQLNMPIRCVSL